MLSRFGYDMTNEDNRLLKESLDLAAKQTSIKLVPVIVKASSNYEHGALAFGFVFSLLAYTIAWFSLLHDGFLVLNTVYFLLSLLLLIVGFSVGGFLASYIPSIKLLFVKKNEQHNTVKRAAAEAFFHYHFDVNKHQDGVIIYVSLLECMVRVQAEARVYEKLTTEQWQLIVKAITDEAKHGNTVLAVVHGIKQCAHLLSQHFPSNTT